MNIGTTGIIVDQMMQLLVIKRDDTRTWTAPGGALDAGELPTDGVVREVEEETGFKVLPVRLVGVTYTPEFGQGLLQFTFRCLLRGGEARTSSESLDVGFIPTNPIKVPMLAFSKIRIERSLVHHENVPYWQQLSFSGRERLVYLALVNLYFPIKNWFNRTFRNRVYTPPPPWQVTVNLIVQRPDGAVLWQTEGSGWQLPEVAVATGEAPWAAAEKLGQQLLHTTPRLNHLTGVYTIGALQHMVLVFSAELPTSATINNQLQFHAQLPNNVSPHHEQRVRDAVDPLQETTVFRQQI